jgi:hypothetical protein
VEISWPASEECPFELKALYRLSAPDTLDLITSVTAHSDLKAFESFLASYFTEAFPASSVYALGDGKDAPLSNDRTGTRAIGRLSRGTGILSPSFRTAAGRLNPTRWTGSSAVTQPARLPCAGTRKRASAPW